MTPENLCYWLQGFLEIQNPNSLNETQIQIIKDHLSLVFKKETPSRVFTRDINPFYPNKWNDRPETLGDWWNLSREDYKAKYGEYPIASC